MTPWTRRTALFAGASLLAAPPVLAQAGALVIEGETIADATLFTAAKREGVVTIYGSLPTRNAEPSIHAFQRDTGLRLDYINLISPRIFARATAEFSANRLEADWLDTTELPMTFDYVQRGILRRPHKVPNFDSIPAGLRDAEGKWYSIFRTPMMIGVNTEEVAAADIPKSWTDLLHPRFRGKIGVPSIDAGGAFFNAYAFLREKVAPDFITRLAAQRCKVFPSSAPMLLDLVRGEISLSFTAPASVRSQMDSNAPITCVFPREGVSAYATTGGITTSAPHPNAAMTFVNWMTSKRGSTVIASSGIYGTEPSAPTPVVQGLTIPPVSQVWTMELDSWLARREEYTTSWRAAFGTR